MVILLIFPGTNVPLKLSGVSPSCVESLLYEGVHVTSNSDKKKPPVKVETITY